MNLPYTLPKWTDGKYKVARPTGLPVFSSPLPNSSKAYQLKQTFQQFRTNWIPLVFNAKHPNYADYVLVAEGEHRDIGGGVVEWERTYCQVPDTYSEFETFPMTFPGIVFESVGLFSSGRQPVSERVQSRLQYDFYLVSQTYTPGSDDYNQVIATNITADANATSSGPGTVAAPYDAPGSIPFLNATYFVQQLYLSGHWYGGTAYPATQLAVGAAYGGTFGTVPTTEQYTRIMMKDALDHGWGASVTSQAVSWVSADNVYIVNPTAADTPATPTPNSSYGGQIIAEDSTLSRWMGNIWVRRSRYVLAQ